MKSKGFTLVELLGVMTILAIIFMLVYPNVMNMMENSKQRDYEEYESNIFLATEAYINANTELSSKLNVEGDSINIYYSDLLTNGYLSSKVVDPVSGKAVADLATKMVTVKVSKNKSFTYSIQ